MLDMVSLGCYTVRVEVTKPKHTTHPVPGQSTTCPGSTTQTLKGLVNRMTITELVDFYREEGLDDSEINHRIPRDLEEAEAAFYEAYENDPMIQEGWRQQDLIDMYRRER